MSDHDGSSLRVLVVDDEEIVMSLVTDALEDEGHEVRGASDGAAGLALASEFQPQLIITDIRMPEMDGIEMVRRARELLPELTVIFMTGYADLNSAKDAIKQGAVEYIMKPFELHEMRQAVDKAVGQIRRGMSDTSSEEQLEKLSDLNQMLYSAGDRKSLATLSLRFALMHCRSERGALLYWNSDLSDIRMVVIVGERTDERELPNEALRKAIEVGCGGACGEPFTIDSLDQHPFSQTVPADELAGYFWPEELSSVESIAYVPLKRAEKFYGTMMIGYDAGAPTIHDSDIKFVSITGSQLSLSLENIGLLEEAQAAYSRLKQLQDETIELEKMATRGEMSAEIGHELNNFLGVVSGNLQLLDFHLNRGHYDQLPKYVSGIADNIEKVQKFTSNLMDLSPIASKMEVLQFDELLEEVVDYLKPQKRYHGVTIRVHPCGQKLPFEADSVHIQQLLYNLFNNAADATVDSDRRDIDVYTERHEVDFTFRIKDSGVGIEPELLTKLFTEKFTTKKTGHGFGLLVCRRVIESHSGILKTRSKPSEGTSIDITFPLAGQKKADDSTFATQKISVVGLDEDNGSREPSLMTD